MKKQNLFMTALFALFMFVIFAASTALAAETVYVSATGKYVVDGVEHEAYTNLQEAVNAVSTTKAATIWVEDGYVFDSGSTNVSDTASRLYINRSKDLTISSRSGKWETGAEIRGAYHSEETPCGENSVRCLEISGGSASILKIIGFRLVGGATTTTGGGLAVLTSSKNYFPTLQNCLIADCHSSKGGGGVYAAPNPWHSKTYIENCTITNCFTGGSGGGLSSQHADRAIFVTNSVIVCNVASNTTPRTGGGVYKCRVWNSLIANNRACSDEDQKGESGGSGGGASDSNLTGCIVSNNISWYRGGGVSGGKVLNCIIVDNISYSSGGGVASSSRVVGSLIARNQAEFVGGVYGYISGSSRSVIENCTIVTNYHEKSSNYGVADFLAITNCVVWGNTRDTNNTRADLEPEAISKVFYSCFPEATEGENGNTAADPKLRTRDGKEYVATAVECRGKGVLLDWMSDATSDLYCDYYGDIRSKNGAAPDMGWAVYKLNGFRIILK